MSNICINEAPFRFGYPVINIRTHEHGRAEIYCATMAENIGKAFHRVGFKEVPVEANLAKLAKAAEESYKKEEGKDCNGLIFFDAHFFERQKTQPHNLSSLRESVFALEELGINYVVASREPLKHEFVYYLEMPAMAIEEVVSLVKESEGYLDSEGAIFSDDERRNVANRSLGLSRTQMKNMFVGAAYYKQNGMDYIEDIERIKNHILEDVGLEVAKPKSLDDIGGLEKLKDFLMLREKGRTLNLALKGILLAGPPGSGKSLSAKAAASVFGTTLVKLDMSRFYSKYLGETEQQFHNALKTIEDINPCVVLVDEIEKYFSSAGGEHETTKRLLGVFLNWLQEREGEIFVVATCNRVDALPPELMRSGRWDRLFFIDLPNHSERKKIFEIHMRKHALRAEDFNMIRLIALSEGYSGADIEQSIIDARYLAHEQGVTVDEAILHQAIDEVTPVSETRKEDIDQIRALKNKGFYCASEDESESRSKRRLSIG